MLITIVIKGKRKNDQRENSCAHFFFDWMNIVSCCPKAFIKKASRRYYPKIFHRTTPYFYRYFLNALPFLGPSFFPLLLLYRIFP